MEAVPRLHMLWFALKTSPEGTSFSSLKKYIAECYQEDPESYSKEIYSLETLRNTAMRPEKDMEGCLILKRYYCQLHSLINRFPKINDKQLFIFTWKDLYINNICEINDIRYEMAAVLFNIAALHSQVGASVTRNDIDGMKLSCTHFQCAGWAFGQLKDKYIGINNNTDFMTPELLLFMQNISFAQAQECILEKSLIDNRKPGIVAKVTAQIINYYSSALVALLTGGEDGTISQVIDNNVFKIWKKYVQFKISYLNCILYLYHGQQSEEQQKMGERVVLYQAAWDKLQEAEKESKGLPDQKEILEAIQFTADIVEGKRKNAKNENEFIYHEALPELSDITAIQGANLVNGISFSCTDTDVSGTDIFARLVPMKAHEASSLYSEEKAEILRQVNTKIEGKDTELQLYMNSLNIDQLNVSEEKANKIPQGIVDRCASINAKTNAIPDLIQSMSNLAEICADVETNLKEIKEILNDEDIQEKQYQQTSGVHRSNAHFTEMTREYQKYLEAHQKAGDSNDTLRRAMELHVNNLRILSRPLNEIQISVPKLSGDVNEEMFKDLKLLLNKVNEMKAQRAQFHADLRINVNDDDITSKVIANGNNDLKELFKNELSKHDSLIKLIDQNLIAQENILSALTDAYAKCAQVLKTMADVTRKKEDFFKQLTASYDVYEDLLGKCAKGLEFYKKLQGNIQKLLTRARAARDVQAEDRQQRIKSITKPQQNKDISNITNNQTSTNSNVGPKLKDYLKGGSKSGSNTNGKNYTNLDSTSSSQYIPPIRPNPLGSENPTAAICTVTPSVPNYYQQQQQQTVGNPGTLDPPPPYTTNLPPAHSQYYDTNGYLNPIYQNTSGIYTQPQQQSLNYYQQGPPPGYTQIQSQFTGNVQQSSDSQSPPQYSQTDNSGYGQQLLQHSNTQGQPTSSSYNLQNYGTTTTQSVTTPTDSNLTGYYRQTGGADMSNNYQAYNRNIGGPQSNLYYQQQVQIPNQHMSVGQSDLNSIMYPNQSSTHSMYNNQPQLDTSYGLPIVPNNSTSTTLTNQMENLNIRNTNQQQQIQQQQAQPQQQQPQSFQTSGYTGYQQNLSNQDCSSVGYQKQQQQQQQIITTSVEQPTALNQSSYSSHPGYVYNQANGEYQYASGYQFDGTLNKYGQLYTSPVHAVSNTTDSTMLTRTEQSYGNQYTANDQQQQQQSVVQQNNVPTTNQNILNTYYQNNPYGGGYQLSQNGTVLQMDQVGQNYQNQLQLNQQINMAAPGNAPMTVNQNVSAKYIQSNNNNTTETTISGIQQQQQPQIQQQQQPQIQKQTQQQQIQPQQSISKNINKPSSSKSKSSNISSSNIDLLSDIDFTGSPAIISTPLLQPQKATRKSSITESETASVTVTTIQSNISNTITTTDPIKLTEMINNNITKKSPSTPDIQSKISNDIIIPENLCNERKSSCDNLSICSDLSSLDQSFDWDSISIRSDQKQINNLFGGVDKDSIITGGVISGINLKSLPSSIIGDPFDDIKLLKYFHKEVERYEKIIETLNIKMLNGNTPLANKWKELQDLLVKNEINRTTTISKLFPEKNRSIDCLPYDHARVVLERSTDDYINAAFVKDLGHGCPNFILAQTPLQNTVNDFWSMIWSQKARTVVCLHTPNEILDTFWPQECNKEMQFDDFSVTLVKQFDLSHCIELNLKLTMNGADAILDLSLLQIKSWTKNSPTQILGIANNILLAHKQRCQEFKINSPLIMNCLTGSERSGLIALAICAILGTKTKRPTLINIVDVWYRICSQRKNALRDTKNLELSMEIVLCYAHDVLNKRGIMTSYQMKNAQTVTSNVKEEIKDPLNDLDPLWKLKK